MVLTRKRPKTINSVVNINPIDQHYVLKFSDQNSTNSTQAMKLLIHPYTKELHYVCNLMIKSIYFA